MTDFMIGTVVRATATFTNAAGTATDPDTVTCKHRVGNATATTVVYDGGTSAVKRTGAGVYYIDLNVTAGPARYVVRWEGTGAVITASEAAFGTADSAFD
jgi:hypothetical protein